MAHVGLQYRKGNKLFLDHVDICFILIFSLCTFVKLTL